MTWSISDKPQIANTIYRDELWLRCPSCGDSKKNPKKAHFSINKNTGYYNCLRCNHSGKLTLKEMIAYFGFSSFAKEMMGEEQVDKFPEVYSMLLPGPTSIRKSKLNRYHYIDEYLNHWDTFLFYQGFTVTPSGILLRKSGQDKRALFYGQRGISWPGAPEPLTSTISFPLQIVEGPYDVLTDRSVTISGMITYSFLEKYLKGHYVELIPDGDIWTDYKNFELFKKTLRRFFHWSSSIWLTGVKYIPDGKDLDEVDPEEIHTFSRYDIIQKLKYKRKVWK